MAHKRRCLLALSAQQWHPHLVEGFSLTDEWTCPFCDRTQLKLTNFHSRFYQLDVGKTVHGLLGLHVAALRCLNPNCNELTLSASLIPGDHNPRGAFQAKSSQKPVSQWTLRPESTSKAQPDCIPAPIREDYFEACLIRDKSPKASATLARRCLQGMIRDFCGISKRRLLDEIVELRKRVEEGTAPKGVEAETVEAIDHVRGIGNIGAHMESDINLIVEVDPGEAQALIELIEMLFEEWYVARQARQEKLDRVRLISQEKRNATHGGNPPATDTAELRTKRMPDDTNAKGNSDQDA